MSPDLKTIGSGCGMGGARETEPASRRSNMNIEEIENCVEVAQRFVMSAIKAKQAIKAIHKEHSEFYPISSKDVASCKRASFDLTRALAELRK